MVVTEILDWKAQSFQPLRGAPIGFTLRENQYLTFIFLVTEQTMSCKCQ